MKRIMLAAASVLFAGVAFAASPEQGLIDIENAWAKAFVAKDVNTIGGFIADDWRAQSDSPKVYGRAAFLADIKSGKLAFKAMTLHDIKVRIFGTIAIVQGSDDETSSYGSENTSGTYNWIDVFVQRGGKWVAVASQVTKVKK